MLVLDSWRSLRFLKFFASTLGNSLTRRACARTMADFLAWCEEPAMSSIAAVEPLDPAAEIEGKMRGHSALMQQLAALRHLFDWLVTG